jgi:hypothetical protein
MALRSSASQERPDAGELGTPTADCPEKHKVPGSEDELEYLTGWKLFLTFLALCLTVFLVALVSYHRCAQSAPS